MFLLWLFCMISLIFFNINLNRLFAFWYTVIYLNESYERARIVFFTNHFSFYSCRKAPHVPFLTVSYTIYMYEHPLRSLTFFFSHFVYEPYGRVPPVLFNVFPIISFTDHVGKHLPCCSTSFRSLLLQPMWQAPLCPLSFLNIHHVLFCSYSSIFMLEHMLICCSFERDTAA